MKNAAGDGLGFAEADATRALPVVRGRKLGSIRYAHSGVDLAGPPPPNDGSGKDIRLAERLRRAGRSRLAERLRLAGRGSPPEIAHE